MVYICCCVEVFVNVMLYTYCSIDVVVYMVWCMCYCRHGGVIMVLYIRCICVVLYGVVYVRLYRWCCSGFIVCVLYMWCCVVGINYIVLYRCGRLYMLLYMCCAIDVDV